MNTAAKGNAAERYVAKWLSDLGWLVASRRHIGGAGDLLAVDTSREGPGNGAPAGTVWLIEVKCCKNLWEQFRRVDREEMKATQLPDGGERWVVNVLPKRELDWRPESSWP